MQNKAFELNLSITKYLCSFLFISSFSSAVIYHFSFNTEVYSSTLLINYCSDEVVKTNIRERLLIIDDYEIEFPSIKSFNSFLSFCRNNSKISIKYQHDVKNLFTFYKRIVYIDKITSQPEKTNHEIKKRQYQDVSIVSLFSFIILSYYIRINNPLKSSRNITLHGKTPYFNSLLIVITLPLILYFAYTAIENIILCSSIILFSLYIWAREVINATHKTNIKYEDENIIIEHIGPFGIKRTLNLDSIYRIEKELKWLIGCKDKLLSYVKLSYITRDNKKFLIGYTSDNRMADKATTMLHILKNKRKK